MPSCEAKGTSRRTPPVTGNLVLSVAVGVIADAADCFDDEEMDNAGAARSMEIGVVDADICVSRGCGNGARRVKYYLEALLEQPFSIRTSSCRREIRQRKNISTKKKREIES